MVMTREQIRGKAAPYLKDWRMHRNMASGELADRADVSRATVSRAETGEAIVSFTNLRKFAKILRCSIDDLTSRPPADGGE